MLGGLVQGLFSVATHNEGIEFLRTGGNAAAAAAALFRFSNYGRRGGLLQRVLPHNGSSGCFHVERRSIGSGEYCGHDAISAMADCLHFLLQVLQRRFISSSFSFIGQRGRYSFLTQPNLSGSCPVCMPVSVS